MIQRLKRWIQSKLFIYDEVIPIIKATSIVQENPRDIETRKRVRQAFKAQEHQMQSRAMKAHDANCIDPWTCQKAICYKWEPDKIVKKNEK